MSEIGPGAPITWIERSKLIVGCTLSQDDLLRLHGILDRKAKEAAELEVAKWQCSEGEDIAKFETTKTRVKSFFEIIVTVEGKNGERLVGPGASILAASTFPEKVIRVYFDSATKFRANLNNQNPRNHFSILFDFGKPPAFELSLPTTQPTPNASNLVVNGADENWVTTVFEKISEFLNARNNHRRFLHRAYVYDVLIWFLGIPFALSNTFKSAKFFGPRFGDVKIVEYTLYLYVFFLSLIFLRFTFSYAKWVWPSVEFDDSRDIVKIHRWWVGGIVVSVIGAILYSLLEK